mmetsp:Transcript_1038/g.2691  ORF Transcript_1038/g.2691 Transcript_1038/m.2691 type:complete len:290 (-) Transcript_1038:1719-2588(-)
MSPSLSRTLAGRSGISSIVSSGGMSVSSVPDVDGAKRSGAETEVVASPRTGTVRLHAATPAASTHSKRQSTFSPDLRLDWLGASAGRSKRAFSSRLPSPPGVASACAEISSTRRSALPELLSSMRTCASRKHQPPSARQCAAARAGSRQLTSKVAPASGWLGWNCSVAPRYIQARRLVFTADHSRARPTQTKAPIIKNTQAGAVALHTRPATGNAMPHQKIAMLQAPRACCGGAGCAWGATAASVGRLRTINQPAPNAAAPIRLNTMEKGSMNSSCRQRRLRSSTALSG